MKSSTGFIFGGYTSVLEEHKRDKTAFIYSLTNPANSPLKLKIKSGKVANAVCHRSTNGPWFSGGLNVSDLSNINTYSGTFSNFYEPQNGQTGIAAGLFFHGGKTPYFQTVEVKVFQIV